MEHFSESEIKTWLAGTERQVLCTSDATVARLRRRFDASVQEIWNACTNRDPLRRWFADVGGNLVEGATLTLDVGAPCKLTSQILRCEPLRRLRLTWSYPGRVSDEVDVRLEAGEGGSVVELEHHSCDKTEWWVGAGSGWEYALIRLSLLLSVDDPSRVSADALDEKLGPLWTAAGRSRACLACAA